MNKLVLIAVMLLFGLWPDNSVAQTTPTRIDNGKDYEVEIWRFKNYEFDSYTPPIARPITKTTISKRINGKWVAIEKNQMFGKNASQVTEKVHAMLLVDFEKNRAESPACYKSLNYPELNAMEISVDKDYMFFSFILDTSYLSDGISPCTFPSVSAAIPIAEITMLIAP